MELKIGKPGRTCGVCERAFEHEEDVYSLIWLEEQKLTREDFCRACWKGDKASGAFSTWITRYIDPSVANQEPPEAFSPLRKVFYDSVESEDRGQLALAYLAAQLLRRQRVFRLVKEFDEGEEGARGALFVDRINDRMVEVKDPNLSYGELETGRNALMAQLAELEGTAGEECEGDHAELQEA